MKSDHKADLYVKNVTGASDEKVTERDINIWVNGRNQLVSSVELHSVQLAQDGFVAKEAWLSTDVEKIKIVRTNFALFPYGGVAWLFYGI